MWRAHPTGLSRIVPKKRELQTPNPVLTRWKRREVVRLELQAETLHSAYTCSSIPPFSFTHTCSVKMCTCKHIVPPASTQDTYSITTSPGSLFTGCVRRAGFNTGPFAARRGSGVGKNAGAGSRRNESNGDEAVWVWPSGCATSLQLLHFPPQTIPSD